MSRLILLDAGPLGMVSNPKATPLNLTCANWLRNLLAVGEQVVVPEIADYEVRRELLRAGKVMGLARLDALKNSLDYIPLTTTIMLQAAEFWAQARQQGRPTAIDTAIDGDVILAAQAAALTGLADEVIIATTNVKHLTLFADAREWQRI